MEKKPSFGIVNRIKSFAYAFKGIVFLYKTQANVYIHTIIGLLVIVVAVSLKVSIAEWCLLIIAIGLVFMAEAFNTSVEQFIDFISPGYRYSAGKAKDLAAAAVLFAAITAACIGLLIFLPKIMDLF